MRKVLLVIPVIALIGASAIAIFATPGLPSGVIDGWVIGDPVTCSQLGAVSSAQCNGLVSRGLATIATPAGASVSNETLHAVGDRVVNGQRVLVNIGQPHSVLGIVVVQFSNGVRHATMFGCAGVTNPGQTPDPLCPGGGQPFP